MQKNQMVINTICKTCKEDSTSHSFNLIGNSLEGGSIFLTKIASATKYSDTEGIVNHCTNYLKYVNPDRWTWIIDFSGFGIKHTLGINTGIQLAKFVNKFGRLKHLIIINTNMFVEQMITIIKLTLKPEYHERIYIIQSKEDIFLKHIMSNWTHTEGENTAIF